MVFAVNPLALGAGRTLFEGAPPRFHCSASRPAVSGTKTCASLGSRDVTCRANPPAKPELGALRRASSVAERGSSRRRAMAGLTSTRPAAERGERPSEHECHGGAPANAPPRTPTTDRVFPEREELCRDDQLVVAMSIRPRVIRRSRREIFEMTAGFRLRSVCSSKWGSRSGSRGCASRWWPETEQDGMNRSARLVARFENSHNSSRGVSRS